MQLAMACYWESRGSKVASDSMVLAGDFIAADCSTPNRCTYLSRDTLTNGPYSCDIWSVTKL